MNGGSGQSGLQNEELVALPYDANKVALMEEIFFDFTLIRWQIERDLN